MYCVVEVLKHLSPLKKHALTLKIFCDKQKTYNICLLETTVFNKNNTYGSNYNLQFLTETIKTWIKTCKKKKKREGVKITFKHS